jgi:3-phosphoshikimate 1-carboxyvinyltransferase
MACAILGLFSEGQTVVRDTECVNTSYPGFYETLQHMMKPGKAIE